MYRQGIGDCFLLSFPRQGKPFHMLIDCGVIGGTRDGDDFMRRVVEDIKSTTADDSGPDSKGRIDVLVVTHEHWDHVSGFVQARDAFEQIGIDEVWLAWTEDPKDKLAKKLREGRKTALAALQRAALRLGAAQPDKAKALMEFLTFHGPGALGAASTESAMDLARQAGKTLRFCRPSEGPIRLPGVERVKVYVLGPPENEDYLHKSNPTKTGREVYEFTLSSEFENAFFSATEYGDLPDDQLTSDQRRQRELAMPFDDCHKITPDAAAKNCFFCHNYGFDAPPTKPTAADKLSWRRIDADWLGAADSLALKLDSDTNNTSLALAIELTDSAGQTKVLLFPGDAQVGSWLSWQELHWPHDARDDDPNVVKATRLLERTAFYKVGHHASHNATLREKGLELMTHPDLVAMIPVNEDVAHNVKHWKNMPLPGLCDRLQTKTRGRVLRADKKVAPIKAGPKDPALTEAEWQQFLQCLSHDLEDELWVQYKIPF
jgi:hypothetical protein